MSLTSKQVELIVNTWGDVKKNPGLQDAGNIVFKKLFEISPTLYQLFPFKDEEISENNTGLAKHALQVMETIDVAIKMLSNGELEKLKETLEDLGAAHSFRSVKSEHFQSVGQALVYALGQALGTKFTKEAQTAWVTLYGAVQNMMEKGMDLDEDF